MKAFLRGNKIVLQKNPEHAEIETLIRAISKDLEKVRSVCEDRNAEDFPEDVIRGMVQNVERLKTKGAKTHVSEDFLDHVIRGGSVLDYFNSIIDQSRSEQDQLLMKKNCFRHFADKLDDILRQ